MVKIRLMKLGAKKRPDYRIVVQDARKPRHGATSEEIGQDHPIAARQETVFDVERAKYWISVGAQPTENVKKIFRMSGLAADGKAISK